MVAEAPRVRCHALGQMVMEVVLIVLSISTCARDICHILGVDVTLSLTGSARGKKGGREAARARAEVDGELYFKLLRIIHENSVTVR